MIPRVAFFTDSFSEANGVALTSRQFEAFARSREYPFLSVHAGPATAHHTEGSIESYEVANSRWILGLEHDLAFDLLFLRNRRKVRNLVAAFRPDLVHITGPGHLGMLGALVAHDLDVPLVASWHTNVHEFAARRLAHLIRGWPEGWRIGLAGLAERLSLALVVRFYQLARLLFAPNPELVDMLQSRTGAEAHLMERGIDTDFFTPVRRRAGNDAFVIGYVGRLSPEKSVRLLAEVERILIQSGIQNYRFLVVGEGSERAWLQEHLQSGELPGLLRGEALANAYASMDMFLFPSTTDTYGNVVLEAMASGLPVVVSALGGPKFLVKAGVNGYIASSAEAIATAVMEVYSHPDRLAQMRAAARESALGRSWESVFERVYDCYDGGFSAGLLWRRTLRASGTISGPGWLGEGTLRGGRIGLRTESSRG